jgi:hypothetical protein
MTVPLNVFVRNKIFMWHCLQEALVRRSRGPLAYPQVNLNSKMPLLAISTRQLILCICLNILVLGP